MGRAARMLMVGLSTALWVSGCSFSEKANNESVQQEEKGHYSGDITETTKSQEELPKFLSDARNDQIAKIYGMAAENQELLQSIPCYCGCGEEGTHTSVKECFISEVNDNGSLVWNSHAMKQTVCVDIVLQASFLQQSGTSLKDIRHAIEAQYQDSNVKPTATPAI